MYCNKPRVFVSVVANWFYSPFGHSKFMERESGVNAQTNEFSHKYKTSDGTETAISTAKKIKDNPPLPRPSRLIPVLSQTIQAELPTSYTQVINIFVLRLRSDKFS